MSQRKKMHLICAIDCPYFIFQVQFHNYLNIARALIKQGSYDISKTYIFFLKKKRLRNRLPFCLILISYQKIISIFVLKIHPRVNNEERKQHYHT